MKLRFQKEIIVFKIIRIITNEKLRDKTLYKRCAILCTETNEKDLFGFFCFSYFRRLRTLPWKSECDVAGRVGEPSDYERRVGGTANVGRERKRKRANKNNRHTRILLWVKKKLFYSLNFQLFHL